MIIELYISVDNYVNMVFTKELLYAQGQIQGGCGGQKTPFQNHIAEPKEWCSSIKTP